MFNMTIIFCVNIFEEVKCCKLLNKFLDPAKFLIPFKSFCKNICYHQSERCLIKHVLPVVHNYISYYSELLVSCYDSRSLKYEKWVTNSIQIGTNLKLTSISHLLTFSQSLTNFCRINESLVHHENFITENRNFILQIKFASDW